MQGPRNSRKFTKGESDLRVGNGARVAVVTIGSYVLNLPSVFCLNLEDFCYVPTLMKNNFLVSRLNKRVLCNFVTMVVTLQCQLC